MKTLASKATLGTLLGTNFAALEKLAHEVERHYKPFGLRRPPSTKVRRIDNPSGPLKKVQKAILKSVLYQRATLPRTMLGGVVGSQLRDAGLYHAGSPCLVTLDLRSCFPRTSYPRVYQVFRDRVGCSDDIARVLTRLTTLFGFVPQGAPTSTFLVNLTLIDLHNELAEVAASLDLRMSFWVDDIAFSGERAREAFEPAIRAVMRHNHAVSCRKKRLMPSSTDQELLGMNVNGKPTITREKWREVSDEIDRLKGHGNPSSRDLNSLYGRVSHAEQINPRHGAALREYARQSLPRQGEDSYTSSRGCNIVKVPRRPSERYIKGAGWVERSPAPLG